MTLPVLYILMRNDLASMNMGKAIAQGSHAANKFVGMAYARFSAELIEDATGIAVLSKANRMLKESVEEWERTSQFCGTVLVLEAPMQTIYDVTDKFINKDYIAGIYHDETYPLIDGQVVHHIPLDTCGYVFVPDKLNDEFAATVLGEIPLCR